MYRSTRDSQLDLFSSASENLKGRSLGIFNKTNSWHNQFRVNVVNRIDEIIFKPLFCDDNGTPNASIRILIGMMILKESQGMSDQKLFEECRFNFLTRSALGLLNIDDNPPAESTYYAFRKRIVDYEDKYEINLFDKVRAQITTSQCLEFQVSGKSIRMDSKLMSSNIAWLNRYELIHETFRLFYKEIKKYDRITPETAQILDDLLKLEGNKITYTCSSEEVNSRLKKLGTLIYCVLPLFSESDTVHYSTLKRVFEEQYLVGEDKIVIERDKTEITAKSVQSPHDTDCTYRDKDGNKIKGYSLNLTESCDEKGLNLIGDVDVRVVSTSDVAFLQDAIGAAEKVFIHKATQVHADGAYHSPENQAFCSDEIELFLHAIQGKKSRFNLDVLEDERLQITDQTTSKIIDYKEIESKNGEKKWRISAEKGYRYFTQKDIDTALIRKKIANTPIEVLQKRNNVEASIFQLGYHYSNAKTRYRGLVKHQMWADMRTLWINFVRILNYLNKISINPVNFYCAKKITFILEINAENFSNSYSALKNEIKYNWNLIFKIKKTF
jgi:hypothetical protein